MSIQARCTGWLPSGDRPSIVVILVFTAAETGVPHERTGLPSMCTVQAPHWPTPQPNFVPFRFSTSRRTHKRGIESGTSTREDRPLTVKVKGMARAPRGKISLRQFPARVKQSLGRTDRFPDVWSRLQAELAAARLTVGARACGS